MSEQSIVYVIGAARTRLIKIGQTTDIRARLATLSTGSPVELSVLWTAPGDQKLEADLHHHFRRQRRHGEWFDLGYADPAEMVAEVAELMGVTAGVFAEERRARRPRASASRPARRQARVTAQVGVARGWAARVYRESLAAGEPLSSRALAARTGVSQSTAARVIAEAHAVPEDDQAAA